eukprot:PhF_6_TR8306/c0_g1_i1/m.12842
MSEADYNAAFAPTTMDDDDQDDVNGFLDGENGGGAITTALPAHISRGVMEFNDEIDNNAADEFSKELATLKEESHALDGKFKLVRKKTLALLRFASPLFKGKKGFDQSKGETDTASDGAPASPKLLTKGHSNLGTGGLHDPALPDELPIDGILNENNDITQETYSVLMQFNDLYKNMIVHKNAQLAALRKQQSGVVAILQEQLRVRTLERDSIQGELSKWNGMDMSRSVNPSVNGGTAGGETHVLSSKQKHAMIASAKLIRSRLAALRISLRSIATTVRFQGTVTDLCSKSILEQLHAKLDNAMRTAPSYEERQNFLTTQIVGLTKKMAHSLDLPQMEDQEMDSVNVRLTNVVKNMEGCCTYIENQVKVNATLQQGGGGGATSATNARKRNGPLVKGNHGGNGRSNIGGGGGGAAGPFARATRDAACQHGEETAPHLLVLAERRVQNLEQNLDELVGLISPREGSSALMRSPSMMASGRAKSILSMSGSGMQQTSNTSISAFGSMMITRKSVYGNSIRGNNTNGSTSGIGRSGDGDNQGGGYHRKGKKVRHRSNTGDGAGNEADVDSVEGEEDEVEEGALLNIGRGKMNTQQSVADLITSEDSKKFFPPLLKAGVHTDTSNDPQRSKSVYLMDQRDEVMRRLEQEHAARGTGKTPLERVQHIKKVLDAMNLSPAERHAIEASVSHAQTIQHATVTLAMKNIVQAAKERKQLETLESLYGVSAATMKHVKAVARHIYCYACGKGPYIATACYTCEGCFTKLYKPNSKPEGPVANAKTKNNTPSEEDQRRFAYFFERLQKAKTKRETECASLKEKLVHEREKLYMNLCGVLSSKATELKISTVAPAATMDNVGTVPTAVPLNPISNSNSTVLHSIMNTNNNQNHQNLNPSSALPNIGKSMWTLKDGPLSELTSVDKSKSQLYRVGAGKVDSAKVSFLTQMRVRQKPHVVTQLPTLNVVQMKKN